MIKTLNLNRQTTAILENAYNISYEREANAIWQASFSLPLNDPKVDKVNLLEYVEITDDLTNEYIGLFRIMPKLTRKNSDAEYVTFECEHVLATLLDSSLFKYHQLSNYTTTDVLTYLINQQNHKHWKLGTVEFTRYFHYAWENENVLSALFSVPKPFNEPFVWTFDTQSYPWTLNLVKPSTNVVSRIKEGYNLRTIEVEENPLESFNRIYPLGAGEGVNQLTIESVNNGVPYLESRLPGEEIREIIWVDRRYTVAESLKADAQALLDDRKTPKATWVASAADVSSITGLSIDKLKMGNVVRLDVEGFPKLDLRIMKESKSDIKGSPGDIQLELGNVVEDLGTTNADLERRQQINELYSQGATNILNFTYQDNCDGDIPAIIPFYVDDDVVNINTIELTFRTKRFRAYSQATKGGGALVKSTKGGGGTTKSTTSGGGTTKSTTSGGAVVKSTSSGGGATPTSSSGGGVAKSTASGGGTTQTTTLYNDHDHVVLDTGLDQQNETGTRHFHNVQVPKSLFSHSHGVTIPNHTHNFDIPNHSHTVNVPAHTHQIDIPNHSHDVTIPAHNHDVTIPDHTHEIELPDHTHEVEHKIVELSTLPSSVVIKVDGNTVPHTSTSGDRINLVDYMSKDSSGKINRGRHEVTITPNGLGRIEADLILRVFIQSQLGGNF